MNDLEKAARACVTHLTMHTTSAHPKAHMFCRGTEANPGCSEVFLMLFQAVEAIDKRNPYGRVEYVDE